MEETMQKTDRQDVYTRITGQIVADLEKGVRPWVKPWNAEHAAGRITCPLRHNGQPYSGINILSLWMSATVQNFAAPIWMTFCQALELDAHVRKGEKGSLVVYANSITRTEHDEKSGEDVEREIPYMKGYTVFNVEQIDGLPELYYAKAAPTLDPVARIDHAEKFLHATGARIAHGGTRAYYSLSTDAVQMPPFESFRDADSYYSTLAHELTHWSGSKNRLDRDFGGHRFAGGPAQRFRVARPPSSGDSAPAREGWPFRVTRRLVRPAFYFCVFEKTNSERKNIMEYDDNDLCSIEALDILRPASDYLLQ